MRLIARTASAAATVLVALAVLVIAAPVQAEGKRVLLLSAYHPTFSHVDDQIEGVRAGLAKAGLGEHAYQLDVEFMDTKRFPEQRNVAEFRSRLRYKLANAPEYDLVIAADDNALTFALAEQKGMFAETPIVFLGVNDRDLARRQQSNPGVTGVVESSSMAGTLRLMRRLTAQDGAVHVISDASTTGRALLERLRTVVADIPAIELKVISLAEMTFAEFERRLAALPPESDLLLLSAFQDESGQTRSFERSLDAIVSHTDAPVYYLWRKGIGEGLLGGRVVSHRVQGRVAGHMAGRILQGTAPSEIPVQTESPNRVIFDYTLLDRYGIDPAALPEDTIRVNEPERVWDTHPYLVLAATVIGVLLLMIIAGLVVFARLRQRTAQRLAWYQRELENSLEERTRARDEAERANAAKSDFLASMSHELRTPLNAVIGYAEIMEQELMGPLGQPQYRDYVRDIRASGEHLLELVNDVLDLSKIEVGRYELNERDVPIAEVVQQAVAIARPKANAKGLALANHVTDGFRVCADERALRQILLNLLTNAVKYTPEGGRVSVEATADGPVSITVRDTGTGIAQADLDSIFEPFRQGENARYHRKQGTGIGLAVSRKLALMHDGDLELQSEEGVGTAVTLYLPESRVVAAAAA
ncbi:Signal transduction histidine kinase [Limimonas halophila]|uniref:histidine kinase n=1 Tax=Limimonas halophila TaxID=1082479 RepID=A0A1G7N419_9PROT|nr:ABC transporter substrate binding protein [Limimonas halophila]SDF68686.1 Signal transduction histidine kinase [Limimonas halophila]